jgi:hypothetical protein
VDNVDAARLSDVVVIAVDVVEERHHEHRTTVVLQHQVVEELERRHAGRGGACGERHLGRRLVVDRLTLGPEREDQLGAVRGHHADGREAIGARHGVGLGEHGGTHGGCTQRGGERGDVVAVGRGQGGERGALRERVT